MLRWYALRFGLSVPLFGRQMHFVESSESRRMTPILSPEPGDRQGIAATLILRYADDQRMRRRDK